jgi:hypothetical protein
MVAVTLIGSACLHHLTHQHIDLEMSSLLVGESEPVNISLDKFEVASVFFLVPVVVGVLFVFIIFNY